MWRDYTINYIKKNKSMIIFVMIAVLVASMFISLLSTLFYNMWIDDIERIKATEGDWQARITIKLNQEEIKEINNFENVEEVIISEDSSYINIYFSKISPPRIKIVAKKLHLILDIILSVMYIKVNQLHIGCTKLIFYLLFSCI